MRDNPTLKEALSQAAGALQNQKEAAILLAHHLKKDRLYLITHEDDILQDPDAYFALIRRREAHEPIEYITSRVSFYGEVFHIAPGALIPRPETELLIDHVKTVIEKNGFTRIAEIGTGSGVIAVMLARFFPHLKITATDINPDALAIARKNALDFGVAEQIELIHTAYLDGINQNFAMIVSNPPYIAEDFPLEKPLGYEPQNALFGGRRGDEILREIIDIACKQGVAYLACEMGYDQRAPLATYMREKGIEKFSFYQDYSGFDRGFVAQLKE